VITGEGSGVGVSGTTVGVSGEGVSGEGVSGEGVSGEGDGTSGVSVFSPDGVEEGSDGVTVGL
jgi:hypothetical protein